MWGDMSAQLLIYNNLFLLFQQDITNMQYDRLIWTLTQIDNEEKNQNGQKHECLKSIVGRLRNSIQLNHNWARYSWYIWTIWLKLSSNYNLGLPAFIKFPRWEFSPGGFYHFCIWGSFPKTQILIRKAFTLVWTHRCISILVQLFVKWTLLWINMSSHRINNFFRLLRKDKDITGAITSLPCHQLTILGQCKLETPSSHICDNLNI